MSLAVRTVTLIGEYCIDLDSIDLVKQLKSLGFAQEEENGNWAPPKPFLLYEDVKSGRVTLSSDINKWHKRHFREFLEANGNKKKLLSLPYEESISIRYGKYEFKNSIRLYDKSWFNKDKKLYQVFLSSKINTFEEWLKFPFKTKVGYVPEFRIPTLNRLRNDQSFMLSIIEELGNKNSELSDKELYLEELSQNKFRPQIISDDGFNQEVFGLTNWFSFFCYELLMDINSNLKINTCKTCHGLIYLDNKDHSDRTYHKKSESLECWQKQERERKRKQRI